LSRSLRGGGAKHILSVYGISGAGG
jgi:hypothetical protein